MDEHMANETLPVTIEHRLELGPMKRLTVSALEQFVHAIHNEKMNDAATIEIVQDYDQRDVLRSIKLVARQS